MLEYDYDAAMLKKEASKKRIAAWGEADYANKLKTILWHFLWYYIYMIIWIHNIDETLQLVSAQKDTYASEL